MATPSARPIIVDLRTRMVLLLLLGDLGPDEG
ncbi:hypothetical protein Ae406Ps2_5990c [Pseudonocardia sp. Ae406_Ps2]|nr:hypothetical protein Ae406Ps2_5990c [Pseudonocardia sp. Ae406_Ps2]